MSPDALSIWSPEKRPETAIPDSQHSAPSHTLSIIPAKLLKRTESFCPFHPSCRPLTDHSGTHDVVSHRLMKMHNLHGNAVRHCVSVLKWNEPKWFRGRGPARYRAMNKHKIFSSFYTLDYIFLQNIFTPTRILLNCWHA